VQQDLYCVIPMPRAFTSGARDLAWTGTDSKRVRATSLTQRLFASITFLTRARSLRRLKCAAVRDDAINVERLA